MRDLAEEVDKEVIVYNQNEIAQVQMLKLKKMQSLKAQKSGINKSTEVDAKKKQSTWCMCLRSKATVANKDSEEASEEEGEPLHNSAYNLSSHMSDRDLSHKRLTEQGPRKR